jgi:hypothetical protein
MTGAHWRTIKDVQVAYAFAVKCNVAIKLPEKQLVMLDWRIPENIE